ncbi:MAG TPA: S41 family peptidase [Terriglobales bacterium]|nr:S41 family peptidase [Terriglobales bacterium]
MFEPNGRLKVISRVKAIVVKRHFNIRNVNYADWCRAVDEQVPALLVANDNDFEEGVRDLLCQLKSSHTNFYRSDTNPILPQHVVGATLRSVRRPSAVQWMFLDVFEGSPAAQAGIRPGHILISVNGTPSVPPTLPEFRFGQEHQATIEFRHRKETRSIVMVVPPVKTKGRRPPLLEPKSPSYRMLGNIGILKIPLFAGAFGIRFSRHLDSAVESLNAQGCNRLIIDLRGCLGGSLGFAHLASYLCPDQIPIGYDVTRKRLQRGYVIAQFPRVPMPGSKLGLLFCLARFSVQDKSLVLLTQGLGKQPFHGHVVVLVNEWTNSAGEIAAQFAKDTKLAITVGQQTRGNVLGATTFDVGYGYQLYLPIFGWYSPSGTYTEGSGVQPDIPIDIDPDRLAYGEDAQVNKALELLESP